MKKMTVLVKQVLMSTLTAGLFATAFTACSDELQNEANALNGNTTESFEVMTLEQYNYSVPVKVNIEGDWEVDIKFNDPSNEFCYALPQKGHGPATIELCMNDNWTEKRNEGELIIRNLNNNNTQTFRLMQKCNLDNPEYAGIITRGKTQEEINDSIAQAELEAKLAKMYQMGNRTKAVGYGYNALSAPNAMSVSKNPIIALKKLANKANDAGAKVAGEISHVSHQTYSGRSYEELFSSVTSTTKSSATKGGLTAEMKATFTETQKSSSSHMFVYTTVDAVITKAYLSGLDGNNMREFLTTNAKKAIDGEGVYATGEAGFKKLVEDYGTHLIKQTDLGGHMVYATTVDKSLTEKTDEANLYAKCSYSNELMKAAMNNDASINANIKSTYKNNIGKVYTRVKAIGGDPTLAVVVDTTDASVEKWNESLANNAAMPVGIGSEEGDLIPLYDLVDTSTDAGKERQARMKEYFETGMAAVMAYDGTSESVTDDTYEIDLSTFAEANGLNDALKHQGTMVFEAWAHNKAVALICKEYIPQISNQGVVTTVYPMNLNKVNLANGRFVGSSMHLPSKLSWNSNGTPNITDDGKDKAMETKVYVRGGKVFNCKPLTGDIVKTTLKGRFLTAQKCDESVSIQFGGAKVYTTPGFDYLNPWLSGLKYNDNYQYPLVKVGNRIWTRENYNGNAPHGSNEKQRYGTNIVKGQIFFTNASVEKASFPKGWRAGKSSDYQTLKNVVSYEYDIEKGIGGTLKDVSGFDLKYNGWYFYETSTTRISKQTYYWNYELKGSGTACEFITPDQHHIRIKKNEMSIVKETYTFAMPVRLCQEL